MTTQSFTPSKSASISQALLGLFVAGLMTFILTPLRVLADQGDGGEMGTHMFDRSSLNITLIILGLVVLVFLAYVVAQDANSRGENGFLWGVIVFLMPMMGLFFYLIFLAIRASEKKQTTNAPAPVTTVPTQPVQTQYIVPQQPTTPAQLVQTQPTTGNVIYCTKCGSANPTSSKFCNTCGAPF